MGEDAELPLRDIHLPEAISWWPPAPGWWLLLGAVLVCTAVVWWWHQRKVATRVRVAAVAEWEKLLHEFQQQQDTSRLVRELSTLLRRAALSCYPRAEVAGLSGEAWLHFLDTTHPRPQQSAFSEGVGRLLLDAPYRPQVDGDGLALHALCGEWLAKLPAQGRGQ